MELAPEAQTDEQPFVEPKGYDPSLVERMSENFGEGAAGTLRGSLVTGAQAAGKAFGDNEEDRTYAKANLQNRALDKAVYDAMSWSNSPMEFGAAFLGQVGGSLTSPESFVNTLPGLGRMADTAVGRIASFGLSQGVVNAGQDAVQQAVEISAGLRKSYDALQTGMSAGLGTVLGTSFGGVGEIAARYMQFRRGGAGRPAAEPLKPDAEIAREDLSRAAAEDPSMRGADEPAIVSPKELVNGEVPEGATPRADVQQPQGGVPEAVAGHQGGIRADTAVGTTVPEARFGQQGRIEGAPVGLTGREFVPAHTFAKSSDLSLVATADRASFDVPTAPLKAPSDILARDAEQFGQRAISDSLIVKDFGALDVERRDVVLSLVRSALQDDEIAKAVVRLVPVDMMDVLSGSKLAPDVLLNKPSVLVDLLPRDANDAVASRVKAINELAPYVALAAAERPLVRPETASLLRESLAARSAVKGDLHVSGKIPYPNREIKPGIVDMHSVGQAEARFVEAVQAKAITPELRADLTPPAEAKTLAEQIVRSAMEGGARFRTAKGSVYEVHSDGTTTRNKAARPDAGHEGDSGPKARSAKTVYLDTEASVLSAAGLNNLGSKGARVVIDGDKATLVTWNDKAGMWGTWRGSRDIPVHDQPAVGRYPLELWEPVSDVDAREAYAGMHAGNQIIELNAASNPKTVGELESAIAKAANGTAPEGMQVKQSTLDAFNAAVRSAAAGTRDGGKPMSLLQFIAKNGGLALDGEAKARNLDKVFIPGGGPLARKSGKTIDGHWREALMEAGYLPKDADGYMSRDITDELFRAIDRERAGNKVFSVHDAEDIPHTNGKPDGIAADVAEAEARIVAEHEAIGLKRADLDPQALHDAAIAIAKGHETDPAVAYERAVMELSQGDGGKSRMSADAGDIQFRRQTGAQKTPPDGGQAAADAAPTGEVISLHEQTLKLAEDLDLPMRQGRLHAGKGVLGKFDLRQGVARVAAIADFGTAAHEAGHAVEQKVGKPLADLIHASAPEIARLDYDQTRMDPREGFAMWVEHWLTNPAYAQKEAPKFTTDFQNLMQDASPKILKSLRDAQAAHTAWLNAPSGEKVGAIVKTQEPETVLRQIKEEGMAQTVSLAVSKAYSGIFDDKSVVTQAVRDLARLARDASGQRMKLEGADNPENLVRLFARNAQAAVRDMLDGVRGYRQIEASGPGLRDAIIMATGQQGRLGFWNTEKVKEFSDYLVLRRAAALYDKFERGGLANRPLAMSKADVLQGIADAEKANPNLSAGAQMVHDYTRNLLKKMYDGGLIEADLFEKLMKEGFYVPFYRDMRDKPASGAAGGGASPDGPGMTEVVKRMRGSDRDIIDPLQSLMTQTFLVNRTLQHNDIIKSFVALARSAQAMGAQGTGRILEEIPAHQIMGKKFDLAEAVASAARQRGIDETDTKVLLGGLADVFGEDPIMATIFRAEPTGKKGEPIVFYKDGGQLKAVRLTAGKEGMALYEALSQLPPVARDWALAIGQASASALRTGIVTNPVFALTNFTRDQIAAAIIRPDYIPFNVRGVGRELTQDKYAQLYSYAGGVSPGAGAQGLHDLQNRSIDALARKGWVVQKIGGLSDLERGHGVERITGPAKAIGEVVEIAETGTRLNVMKSVFEQKKAQGLSDYDAMIEAAAQATDLMDFGRHGSGTLYIRTLVPFLNAHLQGIEKGLWRTMTQPFVRAAMGDMVTEAEKDALKNAGLAWLKLAGVGGALGYMYSLWAQNHRAYQDANDELRATHLIIPGSAFGFDGKILVIPKPFELAMGFNLGEMVGLGIKANDPRAADMALAGMMEVIAPPNVLTSIPLVKTYAELKLNRSFFTGRDIVPERLQALKPQEQFTEKTSALARSIGNALGVSPVKVDYAIGSAFGLYGRDLLALSNTADPNAPAPSLYDQMFVRRFIKNADSASETTKRFWDQAAQRNGQLAKAKATYENMLGGFRDADAIQFLGALPTMEKAFVVLNSSANEDGKPAFSADEKRLHPLVRGATASVALNGMVRELSRDAQNSYEDGSRISMDPAKRRDVIEQLRVLAAMEQYNALVIAKDKGYENRPLEDTTKQWEVIKAHDAKAGAEVATRYATAKIPPTSAIAKIWPDMQKRLIADGSKADLSDLVADAQADGYEFGAERVKKPAKRRIEIAPSAVRLQ